MVLVGQAKKSLESKGFRSSGLGTTMDRGFSSPSS
jgi:hypothetical protein